jgi:hypothetical protein
MLAANRGFLLRGSENGGIVRLVHDYFEILGVSGDARPSEIRRACCRRARATHPDVWEGDATSPPRRAGTPSSDRLPVISELSDAAIDFVDAAAFVDAMRATFFA